jgi:hypothetical protein
MSITDLGPPWDDNGSLVAAPLRYLHTYRMQPKFYGTLKELQDRLLPLDLSGDWEPLANGVWMLRCKGQGWTALVGNQRHRVV